MVRALRRVDQFGAGVNVLDAGRVDISVDLGQTGSKIGASWRG
jgi:hypothetical protein